MIKIKFIKYGGVTFALKDNVYYGFLCDIDLELTNLVNSPNSSTLDRQFFICDNTADYSSNGTKIFEEIAKLRKRHS